MNFPDIDPVFLRLGPLEFRWYGLMYILGFSSAYLIIKKAVRQRGIPLTKEDLGDMIFTVALGIILGGRLGYILFYNFAFYIANPFKLIAVWEGGMSFHGGLVGAVVAGILFCRKKELAFMSMADIAALTAPVGLMFGRIGNFINGELYGRVTDLPWGIVFRDGGSLPRHPSQLYEAFLEGPLTLLIVWAVWRKNRPAGTVLWSFIACYGLCRSLVELVREPDQQLGLFGGIISMGQILSLPMFVLGLAMVWNLNRSVKS